MNRIMLNSFNVLLALLLLLVLPIFRIVDARKRCRTCRRRRGRCGSSVCGFSIDCSQFDSDAESCRAQKDTTNNNIVQSCCRYRVDKCIQEEFHCCPGSTSPICNIYNYIRINNEILYDQVLDPPYDGEGFGDFCRFAETTCPNPLFDKGEGNFTYDEYFGWYQNELSDCFEAYDTQTGTTNLAEFGPQMDVCSDYFGGPTGGYPKYDASQHGKFRVVNCGPSTYVCADYFNYNQFDSTEFQSCNGMIPNPVIGYQDVYTSNDFAICTEPITAENINTLTCENGETIDNYWEANTKGAESYSQYLIPTTSYDSFTTDDGGIVEPWEWTTQHNSLRCKQKTPKGLAKTNKGRKGHKKTGSKKRG